ncbi:Casparian strip membrane protein 1 [Dichanthelium oligosanthes]|uniref:CASP-like protein n=1 Tax=Dichanthelium oligosanthes TaxID=888268 RepID=A0A1E5W6J2_9POAL|nr:Casparian strip membrane protein 1 [Dichanthelium oligosanthes]
MKGSSEHGETSKAPLSRGVSKGLSVLDLILRFIAIIGTLASAIAMGTTNETLPFFTQFIRFKAQYSDLPTLTFFVVANSIVCAYLILSLPLSIVHIIRSRAKFSRLLLIFLDAVRVDCLFV